ncbi:MAG: NAD(P)-dependent glycerol-3-phosphate dehydrogenase [Ignavibacteriales bacterium]|nr:NAD(P)-dependent glycerol-3-phosphate dehydrogenase [Ignavibacteriales bacterium]
MQISILGAGGWGTSLAILLYSNGHRVTLWEYDRHYAKVLARTRKNKLYLPNIKIPKDILITHSLSEAVTKQDMLVIAIPTQYVRGVITKLRKINFTDTIFVSVSKGIENKTLLTVSQIIKNVLKIPDEKIGVLSGPSHAEEVCKSMPTAVVSASSNEITSKQIQVAFNNSYFRVYSSTDILGVELGAALKNVIAIGTGIMDGARLGDNTKAALMTRGITEIARIGVSLGARMETFFGLSGIGDLIVTCMSKHSRNRYVGEQIGKGRKLKNILNGMDMVAEGVETCRSAYQLIKRYDITAPIIEAGYKILFQEKDPVKTTYALMTRDIKPEYDPELFKSIE